MLAQWLATSSRQKDSGSFECAARSLDSIHLPRGVFLLLLLLLLVLFLFFWIFRSLVLKSFVGEKLATACKKAGGVYAPNIASLSPKRCVL